MFRRALVASLAAAVADATWDWDARTMQQRQEAGECLEDNWDRLQLGTQTGIASPLWNGTSTLEHATVMTLDYGSSFKVVTNSRSQEQYVLVQCGTTPPSDAEVTAVKALPSGYTRKSFTIPLQKVIVKETTTMGFIDALAVQDRMVAVSALTVAPCWQKIRSTCGAAITSDVNLTALQDASANGVFMGCAAGGCGNVVNATTGIAFNPTAEPGNLAQAEYLKIMGAFFNREAQANAQFASIKTAYQALTAVANRPTVAWITYSSYGGPSWDQEAFILSLAAYKLLMVTDAGYGNVDETAFAAALPQAIKDESNPAGINYYLKVSDYASKAEAAAAFLNALSSVSAVVDEVYSFNPRDYNFASFEASYELASNSARSSLAFLTNSKVLRIDGTMSSDNNLDWYESRIVHCDWAVEGLRHGISGNTQYRKKYFRNIAANEGITELTESMCDVALPACSNTTFPRIISHGALPQATTSAAYTARVLLAMVVTAVAAFSA